MLAASFESMGQTASIFASAIALISTLYFWLVRVNRERPSLAIEPLSPLEGSALMPQENPTAHQLLKPGDDEIVIGYWTDIAVVNNSIQPNAVLKVETSVRLATGQWQPAATNVIGDSVLPINLAPCTTGRLSLGLSLKTNGTLGGMTNRDRSDLAVKSLDKDVNLRIRIKTVGETWFEFYVGKQSNGQLFVEQPYDSNQLQQRAA